ncbi:VPLPA-CTERM sorting domain-containing protein [Roseobacter sp. S98]|uniref:VPLPA-CTERM sorting domain-containing protein n=1 Tax=Roseobacter algicola (ex Choi et al. 2025) (nom. illeg.) TaxID=3092138 RepID=UPI0035C678F5
MNNRIILAASAACLSVGLATASSAASYTYFDDLFAVSTEDFGSGLLGYVDGNDCQGDGGTVGGFGTDPVCSLGGSPYIVKLDARDFNDSGDPVGSLSAGSEWNSDFGLFSDFGGIIIAEDDTMGWYFEYLNDGDDPGITGFTAKGGNPDGPRPPASGFFVYNYVGPGDSFLGGAGNRVLFDFAQGSSHVTFFDSDSGVSTVPIPAAGWMLIAGLGGLGVMRRFRRS